MVVERLVETESAIEPVFGQAREVFGSRRRIDLSGQRGCVGRHHEIIRQATLQAEAGHTKGTVLIVSGAVGECIGRFRDTPRHTALPAVVDLANDARPAALIEQRPGEGAQEQHRHQILEHRPAPRDESRAPVNAGHRAAEMEPMMLWNIALRDGDHADEARLRRQQIVETAIVATRTFRIGQPVADREDPLSPVVQEVEPHLIDQRLGSRGHRTAQGRVGETWCVERRDTLQHRSGPEMHVASRIDTRRQDQTTALPVRWRPPGGAA